MDQELFWVHRSAVFKEGWLNGNKYSPTLSGDTVHSKVYDHFIGVTLELVQITVPFPVALVWWAFSALIFFRKSVFLELSTGLLSQCPPPPAAEWWATMPSHNVTKSVLQFCKVESILPFPTGNYGHALVYWLTFWPHSSGNGHELQMKSYFIIAKTFQHIWLQSIFHLRHVLCRCSILGSMAGHLW